MEKNYIKSKILLLFMPFFMHTMGTTVYLPQAPSKKVINLKLTEKPSNISVYDWCCQKARENYIQGRNALLNKIKVKTESIYKEKKIIKEKNNKLILKIQKELLSNANNIEKNSIAIKKIVGFHLTIIKYLNNTISPTPK